jgi:hypothetical protein
MCRFCVIFLIFLSLLPRIFSQPGNGSLQKQLNELKSFCNDLQSESSILKSQLRSKDSLTYARMRMEIFEAFNNSRKINFDFLNTTDKIAVTGLFTKLLQANNPTSDILGFRFNETIIKASEKYFKSELKSEKEKLRFGQIVYKLVNNPVISTLANTNPITSVTAAIINTVAGFSTTSVEVEKEGSKIKNISTSTQDAFSQKNIEAFRVELQPYINFYDALNISSAKYMLGLDQINQKYLYLKGKVDSYKHELYSSIQISDTNTLMKLTTILPDPASDRIDHGKCLRDPRIQQCFAIAAKLPVLEQSVKDFRREYDQTLLTFLKEYVSALISAKKLPASSLDQSKIDSLIKDIESFIKSEIP